MGSYDKDNNFLKTPATANDIGLLMKDVCSTWIVLGGRKGHKRAKKLRKRADSWLFTHTNMWHELIGSNIGESQAKQKRKKKIILPSQGDLRRLHQHLKTERENSVYISACELLRKFFYECNAEDPETLRGTLFRKQLATTCIMFDLLEYEVGDLAKFMGDDDKIHRDHYRQRVLERDLINAAKLLEKAQGVYEGNDPENLIVDTDNEENPEPPIQPRHQKNTSFYKSPNSG